MSVLIGYLLIGVALAILQIFLHSRAWDESFWEAAAGEFDSVGPWMFLIVVIAWPLGLDLILIHEGPKNGNGGGKRT